jgi:hypothetical protein
MIIRVPSTSIMGEIDHLKDYSKKALNPKKKKKKKKNMHRNTKTKGWECYKIKLPKIDSCLS